MSELSEIKKMLNEHIAKSNSGHTEIRQSLARIEVHNDYTSEKLKAHDNTIKKLESAHNRQKGAMWVIGSIGLTGLIEFLKNIFK